MSQNKPFQAPEEELRELWGWLRPDPKRRLLPAWGLGVVFIILGSSICAIFFLGEDQQSEIGPNGKGPLLLLVGLLSVFTGMMTMVISALRILSDERSIGFRSDGLTLFDISGQEQTVQWRDLVDIISYPDAKIELKLQDDQRVTVRVEWLGVDPYIFAQALRDEHKRYLFGVPTGLLEHLQLLGLKVTHRIHLASDDKSPSRSPRDK